MHKHAYMWKLTWNILTSPQAAATIVLTGDGRPQSGCGGSLADAAAALARDLAKRRRSRELQREVVVIMDLAQDRRRVAQCAECCIVTNQLRTCPHALQLPHKRVAVHLLCDCPASG